MKKVLTQQFIGIIALMSTVIISITGYAYNTDLDAVNATILNEKADRIKADETILDIIIANKKTSESHCDNLNEKINVVTQDQKNFEKTMGVKIDKIYEYIINIKK